MSRRRIGFVIMTSSVVVFVLALYGFLGPLSEITGILSLAGLLAGGLVLLAAFWHEPRGLPHWIVLAVATVALGLHIYEGNPNIGYLLWGMLPYVLCVVISSFAATRKAAIGGALTALTLDFLVHYDVYSSTRSTAGLAFLFIPLWNTLIFVPAATAVTWLVLRHRSNAKQTAP